MNLFQDQFTKFCNEDYTRIKEDHLSRGILYIDEKFNTEAANVDCLAGGNPIEVKCVRANEISNMPTLKHDGPPEIICLGALCNTNIVLAMSVIAERQNLWETVSIHIVHNLQ